MAIPTRLRTRTERSSSRLDARATRKSAATSANALLQLMWLASPALPVGGFSYSEALEAAVESGLVRSESQASAWLLDQLHLALGRSDMSIVAGAFKAWSRGDFETLVDLNAWTITTRETSELRRQTEQMGRSMVEWLRNRGGEADPRVAQLKALAPAPSWPVAFALAAVQTGAPLREAVLSFSFGWAENMVQASLKAVPLGQSAGQRILAALISDLPDVVDEALARKPGERQAYSPMLAILSSQHETQYSRLFRS